MTRWGIANHFRGTGPALCLAALLCNVLPACTATANVSDVWMSIDQDGARRREEFSTDSSNITCVAEVGIGRKDATVEILIRQIRTAPLGTDAFVTVDRVLSAREFHPGVTNGTPSTLALSMAPSSVDPQTGKLKDDADAPFEPGSYICEVSLDGVKEKTARFNVNYAPCPTMVIQRDTRCVGFYALNDRCPAAGATGTPEPTCTCLEKGWSCP